MQKVIKKKRGLGYHVKDLVKVTGAPVSKRCGKYLAWWVTSNVLCMVGGGGGGGGSVCDGDYLTCLSTVSTMNTVWI